MATESSRGTVLTNNTSTERGAPSINDDSNALVACTTSNPAVYGTSIGFFDFPREVRDLIYKDCLPIFFGPLWNSVVQTNKFAKPGLAQARPQIRHEFAEMYYHDAKISIFRWKPKGNLYGYFHSDLDTYIGDPVQIAELNGFGGLLAMPQSLCGYIRKAAIEIIPASMNYLHISTVVSKLDHIIDSCKKRLAVLPNLIQLVLRVLWCGKAVSRYRDDQIMPTDYEEGEIRKLVRFSADINTTIVCHA
ncbi:hypothetical protein EJ08DRAFT_647546 [Tothia fuscella]|uniref:Uncharacterized protein n=1 Tax=Tothia fuscella TaxID=1048955 RepID=A0A9P4NXM2_9PEZI|nr:hypothetical protein EJ08DRAFT_647546 [Tothia fuscella]